MNGLKELQKASDEALATAKKAIDGCGCWPSLCEKCDTLAGRANEAHSIYATALLAEPVFREPEGAQVYWQKKGWRR